MTVEQSSGPQSRDQLLRGSRFDKQPGGLTFSALSHPPPEQSSGSAETPNARLPVEPLIQKADAFGIKPWDLAPTIDIAVALFPKRARNNNWYTRNREAHRRLYESKESDVLTSFADVLSQYADKHRSEELAVQTLLRLFGDHRTQIAGADVPIRLARYYDDWLSPRLSLRALTDPHRDVLYPDQEFWELAAKHIRHFYDLPGRFERDAAGNHLSIEIEILERYRWPTITPIRQPEVQPSPDHRRA